RVYLHRAAMLVQLFGRDHICCQRCVTFALHLMNHGGKNRLGVIGSAVEVGVREPPREERHAEIEEDVEAFIQPVGVKRTAACACHGGAHGWFPFPAPPGSTLVNTFESVSAIHWNPSGPLTPITSRMPAQAVSACMSRILVPKKMMQEATAASGMVQRSLAHSRP